MARFALLCLLATFTVFSGCLANGPDPMSAAATDPSDPSGTPAIEPAQESQPTTPENVTLPDCPEGGRNNYGIAFTIGGEYIWTGVGGNLVVYYHESNGCDGLQIEEEWAHNPDTKVAEVPGLLLDGTTPSANT